MKNDDSYDEELSTTLLLPMGNDPPRQPKGKKKKINQKALRSNRKSLLTSKS